MELALTSNAKYSAEESKNFPTPNFKNIFRFPFSLESFANILALTVSGPILLVEHFMDEGLKLNSKR